MTATSFIGDGSQLTNLPQYLLVITVMNQEVLRLLITQQQADQEHLLLVMII